MAYGLPSIRDTGSSAKACPIKIPQSTFTSCFTLLSVVHEQFAPFILVRIRRFGGGFAHPFPDVAVFFHESFNSFGTDTLSGLLLQLMDDVLEVFGGILQILLDLLLLVEAECRSTSGARLVV
jgi:hypothetical protein